MCEGGSREVSEYDLRRIADIVGHPVYDWQAEFFNRFNETRRPMQRYPEWFLGGPWHGEDKRVRAPNLDRTIHVAMQPDLNVRDLLDMSPEMDMPVVEQVTYIPQRCMVFGIRLTLWVIQDEIPNLGRIDSPIMKALGELIMFPHRDPEHRPNLEGHTDRYRLRWEMEREVRRELEGVYRQRLMDASIASRPEFNRPEPVERPKLHETVTHGVYLEVVVNGTRLNVNLPTVTTFFDEGNDEVKPAWVATAQGPGIHSETKPYTGYGTSERAAIVALAADALGIYARMVELETEVSS